MFNKLFTIIVFTTLIINMSCKNGSTLKDIDGNVYKTVQIGEQLWMEENLKVTHYQNGDQIPNISDNNVWSNMYEGAYCAYNDDKENISTYGLLYNWYAVNDNRNIAPTGWHVPTDTEWKQLEMYLGMSQSEADDFGWRGKYEGGKLKETGTAHWNSPNVGATNESGFSALPGGYRDDDGSFGNVGGGGEWWSSTEFLYNNNAWTRYLPDGNSYVYRSNYHKLDGYSVRCIKD